MDQDEENEMPKWMDGFLEIKFFDKCQFHESQTNRVINRYCITCDASICKHCVASNHNNHDVLTIYSHVYQQTVPLSEMEPHLDCADIQHYKCNKKWVVSLTPLPHNGSGSQIEGNGACNTCKRKLSDPHISRFCCVTCKVQATAKTKKVSTLLKEHEEGTSHKADEVEQPMRHHKRSRKGVPHRAAESFVSR